MERFLTAHRPPAFSAAGFGARPMRPFLTSLAAALRRRLRAAARPAPTPGLPAWRSYAVYSGALPLRLHKSLRRLP